MYIIVGKIQLIAAIAETALQANGREDTSIRHAMDNNADHITRTFGFQCRKRLKEDIHDQNKLNRALARAIRPVCCLLREQGKCCS